MMIWKLNRSLSILFNLFKNNLLKMYLKLYRKYLLKMHFKLVFQAKIMRLKIGIFIQILWIVARKYTGN